MMKLELEHSKKRPFSRSIPTFEVGEVSMKNPPNHRRKTKGHMTFLQIPCLTWEKSYGKIFESLGKFRPKFEIFLKNMSLYLSLFLICLAKKYIDTYTRYLHTMVFLDTLTRFLLEVLLVSWKLKQTTLIKHIQLLHLLKSGVNGEKCTPPKFKSEFTPESHAGWKTSLSFWVSVTFQWRAVKLQEGMFSC